MLVDFLRKDFKKRQAKNKSYSLRAYARFLKVDPSTLSQILSGRRKLSYTMAKKLTAPLKIDGSVKNILLLTYADTNRKFMIEEDFFVPDETQSAELMSHWEYYAVLSAIEIDNRWDAKKIASFLGTKVSRTSTIIENLLMLGIVRSEKNRLLVTGKNLTAPRTFHRGALLKVHRENIEKALEFLKQEDISAGDFTGITVAISSKRFREAVDRIKDFRRSLGEFLNSPDDEMDCVYRVNFQFFPLSKFNNKASL